MLMTRIHPHRTHYRFAEPYNAGGQTHFLPNKDYPTAFRNYGSDWIVSETGVHFSVYGLLYFCGAKLIDPEKEDLT